MTGINFKVEAFEGPLDLLLQLIQQLEIDIYDIPMADITDQYLEYIHLMKELELDVASEYLVMAATLLAIKSKMLLPKQELEVDFEFDDSVDPRDELVEKLMEYKRFKEAAKQLKEKESERNFYFGKAPMDLGEYDTTGKQANLDVSLNDMLGAFHKMLRRKKLSQPLHTRITKQEISIDQRMNEVMDRIELAHGRVVFEDLFVMATKDDLIVTFLAVLELMKRRQIGVEQAASFAKLYVFSRGEEEL
ncbi:segregation/condensation protein A [Paenilisteria rocourtiae]|uniref:Segregation and condensation protein A n=1 Tax=Listeria rocourtiae TaxID=647910 RepID=A0A4R6ZRL4_9LIST|nr:segregation/condensation protein A [Listeria rocourtiae]EUJ45202.1 segregation and condensation protein A [Listeria rocourtiae FSL F6-920]MBC1434680.1 segregation/condensation protein A [Listeria rocourtiae]MBC1603372.1 segregation/condensation protein A [Listeria rocourtiae]TDR55343.1 condensin subunit ScpA [Listeria rocourtiae]